MSVSGIPVIHCNDIKMNRVTNRDDCMLARHITRTYVIDGVAPIVW